MEWGIILMLLVQVIIRQHGGQLGTPASWAQSAFPLCLRLCPGVTLMRVKLGFGLSGATQRWSFPALGKKAWETQPEERGC